MVKKALVLKFGGSATVGDNGLNPDYIECFLFALSLYLTSMYEKAVFIVGGGPPARKALKEHGEIAGPSIALELTRKHARQLGQEICRIGMPVCGTVPTTFLELRQAITDTDFGVAVGGLELGQTTDAIAMSAAGILTNSGYEVSLVVLSNIEAIYNMPPEMVQARAIKQASLDWFLEERILLNDPSLFKDGMNVPLDPIATGRYQVFAQKVPLYFTKADNIAGVRQFLSGESPDSGTLIADGVEPCFYF
ncbi:MAG: hypothetical protein OEX81_01260 [Candidatus Pacebacteria bacterium]|nr:hypothetical protein [Candidatus Paceibacterota bacterium]